MAGFAAGFFDRVGDIVDGVTGKTQNDAYKRQVENQAKLNAEIVRLQNERLAYERTPEYKKDRQKRLFVAVFVMLACLGLAAYLLRKN